MTRTVLYIILSVVVVAVIIFLFKKVVKSVVGKVAVLVIAMFVFGGAGTFINLNTLSADLQSKLNAVVEELGDSVIRQEGNTIEVKLGEDWYDISKILVDHAGSEITITYDGVQIPMGKTGIASTIEVLEGIGLIK